MELKKEQGIRWNCNYMKSYLNFEKREFTGFIKKIRKNSVSIKWLDHPFISESVVTLEQLKTEEFDLSLSYK